MSSQHTPNLQPGMELILHAPGMRSGHPVHAIVDELDSEMIWFKGSSSPLIAGDVVVLEKPVAGDARYMATAEIEVQAPDRFALRISDQWQRRQQREFVRISTHGIEVRVVRSAPSASENPADKHSRRRDRRKPVAEPEHSDEVLEMLDLSAGGLRFVSPGERQLEEQFVCHFELPGNSCYALPSRVVRAERTFEGYTGRRWVAVEFIGLDEGVRSDLLRWVFREQVRRHRERKNSK